MEPDTRQRRQTSIPLLRRRKVLSPSLILPLGRKELFPSFKREEDFVSLLEEGLRVVIVFNFYIVPSDGV